jgi:hypothetical protein
MTQMVDRETALQTLLPFSGLEERQFAPDDSYGLKVGTNGKVQYQFGSKGDVMPVSQGAWDTLFRVSGLQTNSMIKYMGTDAQAHVVGLLDYSLREKQGTLKALTREGEIQAIIGGKVEMRDPVDYLRVVERAMGGRKNIKGYKVWGTPERQYISLVGSTEFNMGGKDYQRLEGGAQGAKVNDIVASGVQLYVSPYGYSAPGGTGLGLDLSGYWERLLCTNGMTSTQNVMHFTKRADESDDKEWITTNVPSILNKVEAEVDRFKALKDVAVGTHTDEELAAMLQDFGIPPAVRDMIRNRLVNHPVENLYQLANHVTYVASNYSRVLEDPSLVRRLMRVGGNIVQHHSICETCHRVMPKRERRRVAALQEA